MGYEGNLNRELIISLAPDLLMAYGVADPSSGSTSRLSDLGVRVFYNADYLEQHPLARAVDKLFGLSASRKRWQTVSSPLFQPRRWACRKGKGSITDRPAVLLGAPWEDVWYISPANSYIGRLVEGCGRRLHFLI
ncbi:MAG: hypothetical protein R2756_11160 [Bacteroidales bacterium]